MVTIGWPDTVTRGLNATGWACRRARTSRRRPGEAEILAWLHVTFRAPWLMSVIPIRLMVGRGDLDLRRDQRDAGLVDHQRRAARADHDPARRPRHVADHDACSAPPSAARCSATPAARRGPARDVGLRSPAAADPDRVVGIAVLELDPDAGADRRHHINTHRRPGRPGQRHARLGPGRRQQRRAHRARSHEAGRATRDRRC